MAFIKLYRNELEKNYRFLDRLFREHNIRWGITSKLLCGHREYLEEVLRLGIGEVHDSRISNLKTVKEMAPECRTMYIKPPPKDVLSEIVRYADVSLNTELLTLHALSQEAVRQEKIHDVIIMIEMGDLREGVMREDLIDFYSDVFRLPGIQVIGLGTNLNCLHGVMPDEDKLIQLSLYKQIIELRFDREIPLVSGGTTVTIPLLLNGTMPAGVNHFRVGEALFFGNDMFRGGTIEGMSDRVLELYAQVIEVSEKPLVPSGVLGLTPQGKQFQVDEDALGKTGRRAIVDIGTLDIQTQYLEPADPGVTLVDASSDMLVLDVDRAEKEYEVGSTLRFKLRYMGALGLMNSAYIDKVVEG